MASRIEHPESADSHADGRVAGLKGMSPHGGVESRSRASALVECPHCREAAGRLNLLTSMTRYYACDDCNNRWNVSRSSAPASPIGQLVLAG
jgi:hypothetical protein